MFPFHPRAPHNNSIPCRERMKTQVWSGLVWSGQPTTNVLLLLLLLLLVHATHMLTLALVHKTLTPGTPPHYWLPCPALNHSTKNKDVVIITNTPLSNSPTTILNHYTQSNIHIHTQTPGQGWEWLLRRRKSRSFRSDSHWGGMHLPTTVTEEEEEEAAGLAPSRGGLNTTGKYSESRHIKWEFLKRSTISALPCTHVSHY